jgi:hypothetical protein
MPTESRPPLRVDDLDAAYLDLQERMRSAVAADDERGAEAIRTAAVELTATDADGANWRILAPKIVKPRPDFRFHYRYLRDVGEGFRRASRSRFADCPSLAATYSRRMGGGWLAWIVRHAEPISYVAAIAVGVGLWFLLGDLIGGLPGVVVLVGMVVAALALWLSTIRAVAVPYRESQRLATVTRAAAVGVTGAIPWVATIEAGGLTQAGRITLTAAVVTVAAVVSFARHPSPFTFGIALGASVVFVAAGAVVIAEALHESPDELASAQLGTLVAAAVGYPIVTRFAHLRWIPASMVFLTLVAAGSVLTTTGSTPSDLHTFDVTVAGGLAAASAWWWARMIAAPFRAFHRAGAIVIALAVANLVLVRAPWDLFASFFEWVADVPLPVALITVGAAVLVGVAIAIRIAVRRMARSEGRRGPTDGDG